MSHEKGVFCGMLSAWLLTSGALIAGAEGPSLLEEVEAYSRVSSVVGREAEGAVFIAGRLGPIERQIDSLGSVTVTIGNGEPRRLVAVPLDEPGYVVGRIREDGYLRLNPVGRGRLGALWDQFHEGQKIVIGTRRGPVVGALATLSTHLTRLRLDSDDVFVHQRNFVDVGAESAEEVAELGIEVMDPVTLIRRPSVLRGRLVAGPSMRIKAGGIAVAEAARRLARAPGAGTTVFAWTTLNLINGKGLEAVANAHGPFESALLFLPRFGLEREAGELSHAWQPEAGSGFLAAGDLRGIHGQPAPYLPPRPGASTGGPDWGNTRLGFVGLPARFRDTPVEMVSESDVGGLADALVEWAGGSGGATTRPSLPEAAVPTPITDPAHAESAEMLASLVAAYGVSGAEGPVREAIAESLPAWADPETDEEGNLILSFGSKRKGAEHLVFVGHMDETGFRVERVLEDGRLLLERRGGFYPSLWEAQAALVHTRKGDVAGVFEPRQGYFQAQQRRPRSPLTVFVGAASAEDAERLGIVAGETTVTMPKGMHRIGRHRALARGFDDRAGSAALILAARRLDPEMLERRVTFTWSVEEEIGLRGAKFLAKPFADASIVYPVDTFVSSDSPLESDRYAYCPLGQGAVLRVLESINFVPRREMDRLKSLAAGRGIPLQIGMTHGGTDGQPFMANGIVSVPISWPGRYSHSPIEVLDLRDLEALVDLIVALAE